MATQGSRRVDCGDDYNESRDRSFNEIARPLEASRVSVSRCLAAREVAKERPKEPALGRYRASLHVESIRSEPVVNDRVLGELERHFATTHALA